MIHLLVEMNAERLLARCGVEIKAKRTGSLLSAGITGWVSETTCTPCLSHQRVTA